VTIQELVDKYKELIKEYENALKELRMNTCRGGCGKMSLSKEVYVCDDCTVIDDTGKNCKSNVYSVPDDIDWSKAEIIHSDSVDKGLSLCTNGACNRYQKSSCQQCPLWVHTPERRGNYIKRHIGKIIQLINKAKE
jgi:hypothetical protein